MTKRRAFPLVFKEDAPTLDIFKVIQGQLYETNYLLPPDKGDSILPTFTWPSVALFNGQEISYEEEFELKEEADDSSQDEEMLSEDEKATTKWVKDPLTKEIKQDTRV